MATPPILVTLQAKGDDQLIEVPSDVLTDRSAIFKQLITVDNMTEFDVTEFDAEVVRTVIGGGQITRDNFQPVNKMCIAFQFVERQGECTEFYKAMCAALTDDVTACIVERWFLVDLAGYVMKEAWGSRNQLLGPLKERMDVLPLLRRPVKRLHGTSRDTRLGYS